MGRRCGPPQAVATLDEFHDKHTEQQDWNEFFFGQYRNS